MKKSSLGIPKICIQLAKDHIKEPLAMIFNNSLSLGIVPDILKVSPIDKGGDSTDQANFRPISTLSTFAKMFVKLVFNQITNYLDKHYILFEY